MTNFDMDKNHFDLIVIGTGVAATTVAYKCKSAGWSVAVIDSRPFGGTCALRGCDPKKVLVGVADILDWNNRMKNKGIYNGHNNTFEINTLVKINWNELMQFKRTFTESVPKNREDSFHKAGITAFHGLARFANTNTIKINENGRNDGKNINYDGKEEKTINGKYILISTGSTPVPLNIPGEEHVITSDQFLDLDNLPSNIVFIGGGYISFEFSHIAARSGSKVTILHRGKNPLGKFDPDLVDLLLQKSKDTGIDIKLQSSIKKIEKAVNLNRYIISFSNNNDNDDDGKIHTIETDLVIHGAGRIPNIKDLDLESANIEYNPKKGIKVNEYLQSVSNPSVYSAGDASNTKGLPLTPVASYEGDIVSSNLLNGNHVKPNYNGIPSVVFTIPPLSSVGILEEEAKDKGLKYKINYQNTSNWYSSRRINEKYSAYKILIEDADNSNGKNRILGAHLLGHNSEEVINIFALAIRLGITTDKIKEIIFSYPTNSYDITYMLQ